MRLLTKIIVLVHLDLYGGVAERLKALVLKTSESKGSVGLNPTPSPKLCLSVAQFGSAFALGAKCRRFKSFHSDHLYKEYYFMAKKTEEEKSVKKQLKKKKKEEVVSETIFLPIKGFSEKVFSTKDWISGFVTATFLLLALHQFYYGFPILRVISHRIVSWISGD